MKDSVRKIKEKKSTHLNRETLFNVQTPQCFLSSDIKKAYAQKYSEKFKNVFKTLKFVSKSFFSINFFCKSFFWPNIKFVRKSDFSLSKNPKFSRKSNYWFLQ